MQVSTCLMHQCRRRPACHVCTSLPLDFQNKIEFFRTLLQSRCVSVTFWVSLPFDPCAIVSRRRKQPTGFESGTCASSSDACWGHICSWCALTDAICLHESAYRGSRLAVITWCLRWLSGHAEHTQIILLLCETSPNLYLVFSWSGKQ